MSTDRHDMRFEERLLSHVAPKLLYLSNAKYGGDWHSTLHTHLCTELFFVVGGEGQFRIRDQIFPVATGDLVVINPNIPHTETSLHAKPLEYIVLGIDGWEFTLDPELSPEHCIVRFREDHSDILLYLRLMLQEIAAEAPGFETVCQRLLDIFLIYLLRHTKLSVTEAAHSRQGGAECAAVRRYIDLHFKENLTLDLLAAVSHTDKFHMAHCFKREYGVSPMRYMQSLRVRESCRLLESTDHSLSQIALILGFSSPSYFSQSFRKAMGMSPARYRASLRRQSPEPETL